VYDWLLFLHVLSAFLLVGAITYFWWLLLGTRPGRSLLGGRASLRMARPATIAITAGVAGTLIFGVWLAIDVDGYELWDGWILASLVLWAVGTFAGERSGRALTPVGDEFPAPEARRRGTLLHALTSVAALAVLVLMIWKPGA
jgi:uncharacterized membrane protein